jgi:hypothetical protein
MLERGEKWVEGLKLKFEVEVASQLLVIFFGRKCLPIRIFFLVFFFSFCFWRSPVLSPVHSSCRYEHPEIVCTRENDSEVANGMIGSELRLSVVRSVNCLVLLGELVKCHCVGKAYLKPRNHQWRWIGMDRDE